MGARRIGITCGDPSGLGPELIQACLCERKYEGMEFVIYGPREWGERVAKESLAETRAIALSEAVFEAGKPSPDGARVAVAAMEAAAKACKEGRIDAVVTGPIAKSLCAAIGYTFPGQTEFFADRWGGEPTMAFVGAHLRLCLVTWHIALREVADAVTEAALRRAVASAVELGQRLGAERPRVMVCGLNPHAGEDGLLGSEEGERIDPWLEALRGEFSAELIGTVPGDTAFGRAMKGEADVVVAQYHDQGLAPFKAVDFDTGVNVTLGLPHLRVSPDHGTGFDIAGKGLASPESFSRAIELAGRLG